MNTTETTPAVAETTVVDVNDTALDPAPKPSLNGVLDRGNHYSAEYRKTFAMERHVSIKAAQMTSTLATENILPPNTPVKICKTNTDGKVFLIAEVMSCNEQGDLSVQLLFEERRKPYGPNGVELTQCIDGDFLHLKENSKLSYKFGLWTIENRNGVCVISQDAEAKEVQ